MSLFRSEELAIAEGLAGIGYCNPFLPERMALEQHVLGEDYLPSPLIMSWRPTKSPVDNYPNFPRLCERAERLTAALRSRLISTHSFSSSELRMYEDIVLYLLYSRYMPYLNEPLLPGATSGRKAAIAAVWKDFSKDFGHFLNLPERQFPSDYQPAHAFAVLVQLHRAFLGIYEYIIGGSMPIARLRAAVWQSVFSHDMRRYSRVLFRCLSDVPTLILGPSGSGKELVARAIGHSRFVPFDPKTKSFPEDQFEDFHPLNLSALAPTLIESELFGHRRGAFSGAVGERAGWLEACSSSGTVFLDEIGDLEGGLQVKLLRVLQTRVFQRVGETTGRTFSGKIVAATNRDLAVEIHEGRFREDLYFRLCADIIHTPTLREQLVESPDDLATLVSFLTRRIIPDDPTESASLADEVVAWITANLDENYTWPGNIRELEQCARNVMIRGSYRPARDVTGQKESRGRLKLASMVANGELDMDELIRHYTSLAFATHGNYAAAADHLKINWRTVRDKLDLGLVAEYREQPQ
ncbi:MAG TPA: sigma 54-interacting transcriptional regulator [Schlesneria sp.]